MKSVKKVIIVDDEPQARKAIKRVLDHFKDIRVAAECVNGFEAVRSIKEMKPDIVFLDIQMPKLDGFDVLELLEESQPFIVFVTAFDEFAIKAFEKHAIDYLMKPVTIERMSVTLEKVGKQLQLMHKQPLQNLISERKPLQRILVPDRSGIEIIPVEEIIYIEAQDDYIAIKTMRSSFLKNDRLTHLEDALNPADFCRVHRSYIVNLKFIHKIESVTKDSKVLILKDKNKIPVSRAGYDRLIKVI